MERAGAAGSNLPPPETRSAASGAIRFDSEGRPMTEPNATPPPPDPATPPSMPPPPNTPPPPPYTGAPAQPAPTPHDPHSQPPQPVEPLGYGRPSSGPQPYYGSPPSTDDKNLATVAHVLGIFTSFVGPLVIWLVRKDQSPFLDDQGKEALNFQLTLLIGYLIAAVTTVICIGPFIAIGLSVVAIVFGIMGAVATNKGEAYRYPVNIRFIQ